MTQDDWNKALLALTMWREARGEGAVGMQAVGCVIRNRAYAGSTWSTVMSAKWQFSSLTATGDPELVTWPPPGDPQFATAMQLAEGIYDNTIPDNSGSATSYFATTIPDPAWASKMTFTVQIGRQKFYK